MPDFTSTRFGPPGSPRQLRQYNFRHFLPKHGLADVWRTLGGRILRAGTPVPHFDLETTDGRRISPSHFTGRPMLVHIGNGTWPLTTGSVEPLKKLHARYGDQVQFLDVFVRQNHPGELRDTYADYDEKLAGAREYQRLEALPWPIVVDDYAGTVHREWGFEMADPTLLVDADGRVAFAAMWTHVPTLKRAVDALLAQGGRGVVLGGIDRRPHGFAALVDGYRGPRRGGIRGVVELDLSGAGSGMLSRLGNLAKPLLGPLALRAAPWGEEDLEPPARPSSGWSRRL